MSKVQSSLESNRNLHLPNQILPGIIKTNDKIVDPKKLELYRHGRIAATTGAVALNIWAIFGLFKAAVGLIKSTFGLGSNDQAYESLGKAYAKSAIAGTLTGVSHESLPWALGNAGMGLFSSLGLNKIQNLAAFSISDGLAALGMGQVRYRDEKNAFSIQHSIFNNQKLQLFRFLIPIEQSILGFFKRFTTKDGWRSFGTREPYELFQTAGGGLIAAGGLLGIASLFKNKLSEKVQSFAFVPYSLFSLVNLIAFYRDGKVVLDRTNDFGSRKIAETNSMLVEGYSKKIASPILGLNNFLLALKGLGIDSQGNGIYNLAMGIRAIGAGVAFIAFTAQAALKYFIPDLFGPKLKRTVEFNLNPKLAIEQVINFLKPIKIEKAKRSPHISDKFDSEITSDEDAEILKLLEDAKEISSLKGKSQAGLPHPKTCERAFLERYTHTRRVLAITIIFIKALLKNIPDGALKDFLVSHELALKLAAYSHDIGHTWRSHTTEKAIKGHNNDELTIKILKTRNNTSDIYRILFEYFKMNMGDKKAQAYVNHLLDQAVEIIGHKSCLSKLLKMADFYEYIYSKGGDYDSSSAEEGFEYYRIEKIEQDAQEIKLYNDKTNEPQFGFTEQGARNIIDLLHRRYRFNEKFNCNDEVTAWELAYILGLDAADLSLEDVLKMKSEDELDESAYKGVYKLNGYNYRFKIRTVLGGEKSYTGLNPRNTPTVIKKNGEYIDFLTYFYSEMKQNNPEEYCRLLPMVEELTTPKELEIIINVSSQQHDEGAKAVITNESQMKKKGKLSW